ncbi:hypothetical protein LB507_009608 [Fusarium sp. FIESC RH6]|nr:hypothetical protein LB507_009608 [Fusarium sp. FIESC RH6]
MSNSISLGPIEGSVDGSGYKIESGPGSSLQQRIWDMEMGVGLAMILATVQYNSTPELTPQLYSSILWM